MGSEEELQDDQGEGYAGRESCFGGAEAVAEGSGEDGEGQRYEHDQQGDSGRVDADMRATGQDQTEDQSEGQAEPGGELDRTVGAFMTM